MSPHALTFDDTGGLYFADGNRVRRIDANGYVTTVAGRVDAGFGGDGGPAAAALLSAPTHIAVGPPAP